MSWLIFVAALEVEVANACKENKFPKDQCQERLVECVLDGETLNFCMGDYKLDLKKGTNYEY